MSLSYPSICTFLHDNDLDKTGVDGDDDTTVSSGTSGICFRYVAPQVIRGEQLHQSEHLRHQARLCRQHKDGKQATHTGFCFLSSFRKFLRLIYCTVVEFISTSKVVIPLIMTQNFTKSATDYAMF